MLHFTLTFAFNVILNTHPYNASSIEIQCLSKSAISIPNTSECFAHRRPINTIFSIDNIGSPRPHDHHLAHMEWIYPNTPLWYRLDTFSGPATTLKKIQSAHIRGRRNNARESPGKYLFDKLIGARR